MTKTYRHALIAMGYKEVKKGGWLKPVGLGLLVVDESVGKISLWLKDGNGETSLWNEQDFEPTTYNQSLVDIKYSERDLFQFFHGFDSSFEVLTQGRTY